MASALKWEPQCCLMPWESTGQNSDSFCPLQPRVSKTAQMSEVALASAVCSQARWLPAGALCRVPVNLLFVSPAQATVCRGLLFPASDACVSPSRACSAPPLASWPPQPQMVPPQHLLCALCPSWVHFSSSQDTNSLSAWRGWAHSGSFRWQLVRPECFYLN